MDAVTRPCGRPRGPRSLWFREDELGLDRLGHESRWCVETGLDDDARATDVERGGGRGDGVAAVHGAEKIGLGFDRGGADGVLRKIEEL